MSGYNEDKLFQYIKDGNIKSIEEVVRSGADIEGRLGEANIPTGYENIDGTAVKYGNYWLYFDSNPIVVASFFGKLDVVKYFDERINKNNNKESKEDDDKNDRQGRYTPINRAACNGHISVVKYFKDDINTKDRHGRTALMCASGSGHLEIVKWLIEAGAGVNAKNNYGETALSFASSNGHVAVVKYLIENNANVNSKDDGGFTALMRASGSGHLEVVKCLVENKASVNEKNKHGFTALDIASKTNKISVLNYLKSIPSVRDSTKYDKRKIFNYTKDNNLEGVECALVNGASVGAKDEYGQTALMIAVERNYFDIVKFLVEIDTKDDNDKGFNIDAGDGYGRTALIIASECGHLEIVKFLIENKANINSRTNQEYDDYPKGVTALDVASKTKNQAILNYLKSIPSARDSTKYDKNKLHEYAKSGNLEGIECALVNGANINAKDSDGNTALMLSLKHGYLNIVKSLVDSGVNLNFKESDGFTALMIATENEHLEIMKYLILNGANINAKTTVQHGEYPAQSTALSIATKKGKTEIVEYLTKNMEYQKPKGK